MGTNTFREPPVAGDEPVGASLVTLGGLLKHLAFVEDYYFSYKLFGRDPGPPWSNADAGAFDRPLPTAATLVADLIDEYARHNGHADLIRESIDGLVGEDPPITVEP